MNDNHDSSGLNPTTLGNAILGSMKRDVAPKGAKERTLTALGIGAGVALTTTAAVGATTGSSSLVLLKIVGAALVGVTCVGGGLVVYQKLATTPVGTPSPSAVASATVTPDAEATAAPPPPPAVEASAEPVASSADQTNVAPPAPSVSGKRPARTLTEEIRAIDEIRTALGSGNGQRALSLIQRYRSDFPKGQMGAEVLLMEIQALMATGQQARAKALAKSFLASNPKSPLVKRVASIAGIAVDATDTSKP